MKSDRATGHDYAIAGAFAGISLLLWALVADFTKSDLASWVQAIGSIAAIVGAWLGTQHQIRSAEKTRQRDRADLLVEHADICLAVAEDAVRALAHIAGEFQFDRDRHGFTTIGAERVEAILQMVETVAQKDIPPQLFIQLIPLQREVAFTLTAARQHNSARSIPSADRVSKAYKRAAAVTDCKDKLRRVRIEYVVNRNRR